MPRIVISLIVALIIAISVAYFLMSTATRQEGVLRIFCAGSLKIPLEKLAEVYESRYGVRVVIEPSGSVEAIRKVTDLGKVCDVIAVADYRLIPKFMVPNHADWYVAFATNSIVLAFTDKSRYCDELLRNPSKWYEILMRSNVRYGFSDPNKDPCGYRAVGLLVLSSLYYRNWSIAEKLLLENTNAKVERIGDTYHVYIPAQLEVRNNLVIRPKSVDLIALLEASELDYAFEYRSVAIQHGLKFIELPKEINLSTPENTNFYRKVIIHILCGTDKEKEISMEPIVYGVTIPKVAKNVDSALKFVELLLSDEGKSIFEALGQPFLKEPLGFGNIPDEIKGLVRIAESGK